MRQGRKYLEEPDSRWYKETCFVTLPCSLSNIDPEIVAERVGEGALSRASIIYMGIGVESEKQ